MVAINYAKDIRVGEQPAKAVALGSNFVWPPLPERLFLRGQSLVYDFANQRYGVRRPGHFTLVAEDTPSGIGYISEEFAASQGAPELAVGSISGQPASGFNLLGLEFADAGIVTQLTAIFQGDVEESLAGIRVWVDGVEVEGSAVHIVYDANLDFTIVAYTNPTMDPWVDGGQYNIGITLDGQELPENYYYTTNINDLGILTRASTATYWGPEGSLLEAAVDEARIQHDPVTGEPLGLMVESEATNDFPEGLFEPLANDDPALITTVEDEKLPEVQVTRIVGADDNYEGFRNYRTNTSVARSAAEAGPRRLTLLVKPSEPVRYMRVSTSTGGTHSPTHAYSASVDLWELQTNRESSQYYDFYLQDVGGGWVFVSFTAESSSTYIRLSVAFGMDGQGATDYVNWTPIPEGGEVLLAIPQHYADTTEHIKTYTPTSGSPVTRAADDAVIDLTDVFNPDEGTYVVRAVVKDDGEVEFYAGWFASQIPERFAILRISRGIEIAAPSSAGYREVFSVPEEVQAGDVITIAMAYSDGECVGSAFGEVVRGSSGGFLAPSRINLVRGVGRTSAQYNASLESSGTIAGFEYYPRALAAEELTRITAFTPGDNP